MLPIKPYAETCELEKRPGELLNSRASRHSLIRTKPRVCEMAGCVKQYSFNSRQFDLMHSKKNYSLDDRIIRAARFITEG